MLIYIVSSNVSGGYYKIGHTSDLERRMKNIIYGITPDLMIMPVALWKAHVGLENFLHRKFNNARQRGEWFGQDNELTEWIEEDCPLPDEILLRFSASRLQFDMTHIILPFFRAANDRRCYAQGPEYEKDLNELRKIIP